MACVADCVSRLAQQSAAERDASAMLCAASRVGDGAVLVEELCAIAQPDVLSCDASAFLAAIAGHMIACRRLRVLEQLARELSPLLVACLRQRHDDGALWLAARAHAHIQIVLLGCKCCRGARS